MNSPDARHFNIGWLLSLALALLITLILAGNGLVILQFERARLQSDRLTEVNQQMIAVLRLQDSLLSFHQQLNELTESRSAQRLITEAAPLRATLAEQARRTRSTLAYLPSEFHLDPAFLTTLDTIEITLPSQLADIIALANAGDWEAARLRVANELKPMETATSAVASRIDRDLAEELPRAVKNTRDVQRRILLIVPATAISTVLIAAFFGWGVTRRFILLRLEERLQERTRIARDLHDTLLQSFQGALMMFENLAHRLPEGSETRATLEGIVERARRAVTEGRDAVQGLRSSTAHDLAQGIRAFGEELAAEHTGSHEFLVRVEGASRRLAPLAQDEIHRVASELIRNAFLHAEAPLIEVEIRYEQRQFRLRVRDDGKGIDPDILAAGHRDGHYGLRGVHERAKLLGGELVLTSQIGSGTQAELTIPASLAYLK